jgi:cytochrome c556
MPNDKNIDHINISLTIELYHQTIDRLMITTLSGIAFVAALFLMATPPAFAHDGATGIVKERMDAMLTLGSTMKSLLKIVKGRVEFDASKVQELTGQLTKHSGSNLTKLLPNGSLDAPSAAVPEIWKD